MIKVLYIYWDKKFINAPKVVKKCLISWKLKNPTWKVIKLNDQNLSEYINIEKEIPNIKKKNITKTSYSDIVKIFILAKYGGCWCDATTFCNQSLDIWLNKNTSTGFFIFVKAVKDRLLSSCFLYSKKNNYIIQKWKEKTILYWKNHKKKHNYFWFHYLFDKLYNSDNKFKEIWDMTRKISANGPHYLINQGLLKKISNKVKNHIDNNKTPLYKLSYKFDVNNYSNNCNLSYLMNKINLKFLHIPKTGGTSIEDAAKKKNLLWGRFDKRFISNKYGCFPWHHPQKINSYCFCVIRYPFDRLISEFYHENEIENYNSKNLNNFIKVRIKEFKININIKNNHFLHQYKFCEFCNIIISFDDLQKNLNKLMKLFNLPLLELEKLPGGKDQQEKRKNCNFKKLKELDINEQNRNLIKKIYKLDFDLYDKVKQKGIIIKF